jgi:hypothetical protein
MDDIDILIESLAALAGLKLTDAPKKFHAGDRVSANEDSHAYFPGVATVVDYKDDGTVRVKRDDGVDGRDGTWWTFPEDLKEA